MGSQSTHRDYPNVSVERDYPVEPVERLSGAMGSQSTHRDYPHASVERDYPVEPVERLSGGDPSLCPCVSPDELPYRRSTTKDGQGQPEILLEYPAWVKLTGKLGKGLFTRPHDYGTFCGAHDWGTEPLCAIKRMGQHLRWCDKPWCYVSSECACGQAAKEKGAKMTLPFAMSSTVESDSHLYFSYKVCNKSETNADKRSKDHFCAMQHSVANLPYDLQCKQDAAKRCYEDAHPSAFISEDAHGISARNVRMGAAPLLFFVALVAAM